MSSDAYDLSDGPTCCDGSASGGAPCIAIHSDICVVNARLKEMKPSVELLCLFSVHMVHVH